MWRVVNHICQYFPLFASISQYFLVNATGMANMLICRHFANLGLESSTLPLSNNYTGELVGILIALEFMVSLDDQIQLKDRNIHFFTGCQPAIIAAFNSSIPSGKVDIILQIKECVTKLHWVPGHRDIEGNELAD